MTIASSLIESICEASMVPDKLNTDAQLFGGQYYGYSDRHWIFTFGYEDEAVDFMSKIDVDMAAPVDCGSSMRADDSGLFIVYVPETKYKPE